MFIYIMFTTDNSTTREEALHLIIQNMNKSSIYQPLGFFLDGSGCSCCRSEYFYLFCKIGNDYKLFFYDSYIKHSKDCMLIRCSCNNPFIWKNVKPSEVGYNEDVGYDYMLENSISIDNDLWKDDCRYYVEQLKENEMIFLYNENDEETSKNYDFYF